MGKTLSTSITHGVNLSGASYNPYTLTSTGTINTTNAYGVESNYDRITLINAGLIKAATYGFTVSSPFGTLENTGTLIATSGIAAAFKYGGVIFNESSNALISGVDGGVQIKSIAFINNAGTIQGTYGGGAYGVSFKGGGSLINSGTITGSGPAYGVYLENGSYLDNSGHAALIRGGAAGVDIKGGVTNQLINAGTIAGTSANAIGIKLTGAATLTNASGGLISASVVGIFGEAGAPSVTLSNAGSISGNTGNAITIDTIGNISNSSAGHIHGGVSGIVIAGTSGTVTNVGSIGGQSGYGVYFAATATGTVSNSGTISGSKDAIRFKSGGDLLIVDPGAVFTGTVAAAGDTSILELTSGTASLAGIGTEFSGFGTFSFDAGAAWTISGQSLGLQGAEFDGFTKNDTLDITNLAFLATETLALDASSVLAATEGAVTVDLTFASLPTGSDFALKTDSHGGTLIEEVTCFSAGTRIATAQGEVPVERLQIGMQVKTLHAGLQPIKWIGKRAYAAPFANHPKVLPITLQANAIRPGIPCRDLVVSPGHAICIDDALIHASRLINGITITQARSIDQITYFHIELEHHEIIFAENCPAETFLGENFRQQFQNAAEFRALYPGQAAPEDPCLPRLEQGFQLGAILRRLNARARILTSSQPPGPLRGYIDQITHVCSGWAQDMSAPEEPVYLDIMNGSKRLARVLANQYRADVRAAGFGSGNHGFDVPLPSGLTGPITVRRSADGADLQAVEDLKKAAAF